MKRALLLFTFAAVTSISLVAAADPVALDYRAPDASCPDAGRFADEVAAKLGFVPWDDKASAHVSVRIQRTGTTFTGTYTNAGGGVSKVFAGATCAEVESTLAVSVAALLDENTIGSLYGTDLLTGEGAPEPAKPVDDGMIPVTFSSADGRRIDVSLNNEGGVGHASDGTTYSIDYLKGICTTPCTARFPRGRHYFLFDDPDSGTSSTSKFLLDEPTTITLKRHSRRGTRRTMLITGAVLTGVGIFGFTRGGGAGIVVGLSGTILGVPLMTTSLFLADSFDATTSRTP